VQAFAYETEAQTFFAAADAGLAAASQPTLTAREKWHYNRFFKRMKAAGLLSKMQGAWFTAARHAAIRHINLANPGTYTLTQVGSPTIVASDSVASTAVDPAAAFYDTGVPLSALGQNNNHMAAFSPAYVSDDASVGGAIDASVGLTIAPYVTTDNFPKARSASGLQTVSTTASTWAAEGFVMVSRDNSADFVFHRNDVTLGTQTVASSAFGNRNIYIGAVNNAGTPSAASPKPVGFFSVGTAISAEADRAKLYNIVRTLWEAIRYGQPLMEEQGIGTANVSVDFIAYGTTPGSIQAAYEAHRQGRTVAIVGGWRDHPGNLGGMMANGLGYSDFDNVDGMGGLMKWTADQIKVLSGRTDNRFEPRFANYVFRQMLDAARTGGRDVPIYYTGGVATVTKGGTNINSITTTDGRTFSASQWFDGSYEGDLMAKAGVSYTVGREAAGTGANANNGNRKLLTESGSNNHQYKKDATFHNVDPWVVPGDTGSGFINGVHALASAQTEGAADALVQAYNFRMTMATTAAHRVVLPSTAPAGYSAANYEALFRWMVVAPTLVITNMLKPDTISSVTSVLDVNATGGFSIDLWGGSWSYPEADYATRETLWKNHEKHIRGWFYALQYDPDSRVVAGVRTAALTYGLSDQHYSDPHPNDDFHWPSQLYVREARRMVSDVVWDGNDMAAADGGMPRSTRTIAVASYAMDSHHVQGLADEVSPGVWRIWNEGNFEDQSAGAADKLSPIPYDVIVPMAAECTNLTVGFASSLDHAGFGSYRMEFTFQQVGQSAGMAAALAIENGVTIQNVDYSTLRSRLLASPTLPGEVAPVLPQAH
jgi:hypothetical protein